DPTIDRDLETVLLRCLAKDPARRFPTAQALANDLGRLLAGEPIASRRPSARERAAKILRRHPLLALTFSFAAALSGLAVAARHRSSLVAEAAQRVGREAASIETLMRDSKLLPLHDTRPEKAVVKARIAALTTELGHVDS